MKNVVIAASMLSLLFFSFPGSLYCEKAAYLVAVKLEKVERMPALETEIKIQNGELFDSGPMAVVWSPVPEGFRFRLYNKGKEDITILWNECSFIDEKGGSHKISHKDENMKRPTLEDTLAMNPSVVTVGGNRQDVVFPFDSDYISQEKDFVPYSSGERDTTDDESIRSKDLRTRPIFIDKYQEKNAQKLMKKNRKKNPDLTFENYINNLAYTVVLVLKIGETKYDYRFTFRASLKQ